MMLLKHTNHLHLFLILFISSFINPNFADTFTCDPTISCGCSVDSTSITARIVGGELAPNHAWGWALPLFRSGRHVCGAVLISPEYALTAAHCVDDGTSPSDLSISAGTNYLSDSSSIVQKRQIIEFYIHPNFDSSTDTYDIAVLHFSPLTISINSTAKIICLPTANVDPFSTGSNLIAVGWGVTYEGSFTSSEYLRQVTVQVFSSTSNDCIRAPIADSSVQLCAGVIGGGKDSCKGDSGGPLMAFVNDKWVLVGMTSSGVGCARPGFPGLYTRVSAFVSFIDYVINFGGITAGTTKLKTTTQTTTVRRSSANNPRSHQNFLYILGLFLFIKFYC